VVSAALDRLPALARRLATTESIENLVIGGVLAATAAAIMIREVRGPRSRMPGWMTHGGEVHVITRAGSQPTVVFENGLGFPARMWSWVQRGLPPGIASIAHDRPGSGWSPPQRRLGAMAYPESLRATTRSMAAYAPFILVGHSAGGLLIRSFARHFPDLVGGLVFVDSAHPEQYVRSPAQAAALDRLRNDLDQMIVRRRRGVNPRLSSTMPLDMLPADMRFETQDVMFRPRALWAARHELDLCQREWTVEAAELTTFAGRPVAVVSAQQSIERDPVIGEFHEELTQLSERHQRVVVPGADHRTLLTHAPYAAHVTEAIAWVIRQLSPAGTSQTQQGGRS
jgi:pimeloyl-ACP methyl ester carboxylesterase